MSSGGLTLQMFLLKRGIKTFAFCREAGVHTSVAQRLLNDPDARCSAENSRRIAAATGGAIVPPVRCPVDHQKWRKISALREQKVRWAEIAERFGYRSEKMASHAFRRWRIRDAISDYNRHAGLAE